MADDLEFTVDKFIFRVATDRYYTAEGMWAKPENDHVRVGISDYLQQRSGDVAFAEIKPTGTFLQPGEELAVVETIKVNISLASPVAGRVRETNPIMKTSPEAVNQDPYGIGWLALIEVSGGKASLEHLLDAGAYYSKIKQEAEQEVNKE